jgi:hypothetical protein
MIFRIRLGGWSSMTNLRKLASGKTLLLLKRGQMRRLLFVLVLAGCLSTAASATVVLNFEGLLSDEPIDSFYNGGLGGFGSGPGPSFGITFTSNSLALNSGNYAGEPSPPGILFFLTGAAATMNVPAGFTTGFSFFYSAAFFPGHIKVWSGTGGTGTLLADVVLPTTPNGGSNPACGFRNFCPFEPFGIAFAGTAKSVDFGGSENQVAFDDGTVGSVTPGGGDGSVLTTGFMVILIPFRPVATMV